MDLLGSILDNMAKPPSMSEKEKEKRKKEKEMAKKMEEKHKQVTKQFREKMEKKISDFLNNDTENRKIIFPPMEKYQRSIVHDVAEVAGLVTHSFGQEDIDRHIVVWKKEFTPCDDELECMKKGITDFDPVEYARMKIEEEKRLREEEKEAAMSRKRDKKFVPAKGNYQEKYEHLIGKESALEAAKKTELNKSYGMVSAEMKKDKRTVEDIQAEIRAKRKRKLQEQQEQKSDS